MSEFENMNLCPMLIGIEKDAFDSENYIYELNFEGSRCLAYVDYNSISFRNVGNINYNLLFPELNNLYIQAKSRCILDGELIIFIDGKPNSDELKRRAMMRDPFKIKIAAEKYPACYTAFDIVFLEDKYLIDLPLTERKNLLADNIYENSRLASSRYVSEYGTEFYHLAKKIELKGVIAKRKNSKYYFGRKTKDWIKINS